MSSPTQKSKNVEQSSHINIIDNSQLQQQADDLFYVSTRRQGGFGEVFLAYHYLRQHDLIAIKKIKIDTSTPADKIDEIFKESKSLAKLDHQKYLEGGDLKQYLQNQPDQRVGENEARTIIQQVIKAIHFCHRHEIIHRDIKPLNILLVKENQIDQIKIIDFGIAGRLNLRAGEESRAGTLLYMPPEVLSGSDIKSNPAIDVWAIGVMLYQLVIGKFPFNGENNYDIRQAIMKGDLVFPEEISISKELKQLIEKMLLKEKRKRIKMFEIMDNQWLFPKIQTDIEDSQTFSQSKLKDLVAPNNENLNDASLVNIISQENIGQRSISISPESKIKKQRQSKYYLLNYMMKNSTVSKTQALNEKFLKQIFEYNGLKYNQSYYGMVQTYVSRQFDQNINLMPVINTLKKLNEENLDVLQSPQKEEVSQQENKQIEIESPTIPKLGKPKSQMTRHVNLSRQFQVPQKTEEEELNHFFNTEQRSRNSFANENGQKVQGGSFNHQTRFLTKNYNQVVPSIQSIESIPIKDIKKTYQNIKHNNEPTIISSVFIHNNPMISLNRYIKDPLTHSRSRIYSMGNNNQLTSSQQREISGERSMFNSSPTNKKMNQLPPIEERQSSKQDNYASNDKKQQRNIKSKYSSIFPHLNSSSFILDTKSQATTNNQTNSEHLVHHDLNYLKDHIGSVEKLSSQDDEFFSHVNSQNYESYLHITKQRLSLKCDRSKIINQFKGIQLEQDDQADYTSNIQIRENSLEKNIPRKQSLSPTRIQRVQQIAMRQNNQMTIPSQESLILHNKNQVNLLIKNETRDISKDSNFQQPRAKSLTKLQKINFINNQKQSPDAQVTQNHPINVKKRKQFLKEVLQQNMSFQKQTQKGKKFKKNELAEYLSKQLGLENNNNKSIMIAK
eukprot:403356272